MQLDFCLIALKILRGLCEALTVSNGLRFVTFLGFLGLPVSTSSDDDGDDDDDDDDDDGDDDEANHFYRHVNNPCEVWKDSLEVLPNTFYMPL